MNLSDISSHLGLSVSTVSRALRNADGVDSGTRAKVLAAATKGGYRGPARSLAGRNRTRTLLALSHSASGAIQSGAMAGMSQAAIELNVSILTHQPPNDAPESILIPKHQPPAMRAGQVDGIVLLQEWPGGVVARLTEILPVVTLMHDSGFADCVGIDAMDGLLKILRHLSATHRGPVGFFGLSEESPDALRLFAAYAAACAALGKVCDASHTVLVKGTPGPEGLEAEKAALKIRLTHLLKNGIRAWICPDETRAGMLQELVQGLGWKIPEDVGIAVYLTNGRQPSVGPRWTTLDFSAENLGIALVRRLLHRIESPMEPVRSILLKASLVPGEIPAIKDLK